MAKSQLKPKEEVILVLTAKKGKWEIYKSITKGIRTYGTRLLSRNGKLICGNTGFNTLASAKKNIKAVVASC